MARLVLINLGLHGHINPTLAMVRELVRRGESVTYFAPEEFGPLIRKTGADFQAYRSIFGHSVPEQTDSTGRTPMPIRLVNDCLQALPQLRQAVAAIGPDAILFDVMCLQGKLLAEILNKPAIRLSSTFLLNDQIAWKPKAAKDPAVMESVAAKIAALCAEFGASPFHFQDIFSQSSDLNIVFTTREFQPQAETFDHRHVFVGASLDQPPPRARRQDGDLPFVYVALGTLANNKPDFYQACRLGLAGKRVLMAVGNRIDLAQLGDFPAEFEIVRHAPQLSALTAADIFVSHGGMNSLMEALYFGVPLVLVPQTEEQVLNAERVCSLGAGIMLSEANLGADNIGTAVHTVLSDSSFHRRAEQIGQQMRRSGGFNLAADHVQKFVTESKN